MNNKKLTLKQFASYGKGLIVYSPDATYEVGAYDFENEFLHPVKSAMLTNEFIRAENCIPHLRSMKSLTKKITIKGYNDNKPFIPLIHLAREISDIENWKLNSLANKIEAENKYYKDIFYDFYFHFDLKCFLLHRIEFDLLKKECKSISSKFIHNAYKLYDLLNLWKFNYRDVEYIEIID